MVYQIISDLKYSTNTGNQVFPVYLLSL